LGGSSFGGKIAGGRAGGKGWLSMARPGVSVPFGWQSTAWEETLEQPTPADGIEQVVRTYIDACNRADAGAIRACFRVDAVHYFPHVARWSGASVIGTNFAQAVRERGSFWTVDELLADAGRCAAALEWTRFDQHSGPVLRGVDWFVLEPQTLRITEVRPYTAAPLHPDAARQELVDFDYSGRGYPTIRP
jgi:hypothetical protein